MSKLSNIFNGLAITLILPVVTDHQSVAIAGPENLVCNSGFKKVKTNHNSIKCKKSSGGLSSRAVARERANNAISQAGRLAAMGIQALRSRKYN